MPGAKRLQRIQFGFETTPGTPVAATTLWRGAGNMPDDQTKIEEIEEFVGLVDGMDRTAIVQKMAAIELASTPATFEQFPYLPALAWGSSRTGAADGSGTDKIYTTNIPTTTLPAGSAASFRAGDNFESEILEYCVCKKFGLSGKTGETVKMSGSIIGRQVTTGTFTGSLTIPPVEEVITSMGKVYLDDVSGGTYGTTQVSNAILGFKIDVEIQQIAKFFMDGLLTYSLVMNTGHKVTGSLTYEHDTAVSGSGGAKAFFRNQAAKLLRLDFTGSTVVTPGTAYSAKHLIVDLPIKFSKPGVIGDQNGNDIVEMPFRSRYNATAGNAGKFITVNTLTTLP